MTRTFYRFFFLLTLGFCTNSFAAISQQRNYDSLHIVIAGAKYKNAHAHEKLWGSNYRDIWAAPVTVRTLLLDEINGGLKPIGSIDTAETKTLMLSDKQGNLFVIHSLKRSVSKLVPQQLKGTFVEKRANDEVSMLNPYAQATIGFLAEKAAIRHTNAVYFYLPQQAALDTFNTVYGNDVYVFEQQFLSDAQSADSFKNYISTAQLLDSLNLNAGNTIDEHAFIKVRLFDMLINDWNQSEPQWSMAEKIADGKTVYVPVSGNHDAAYSTHNGLLLNTALNASGLNFIQPFNNNVKDITSFNSLEKNIDRRLAIEATLANWQNAAKELQQLLTDDVIEKAVKNFPPEVFNMVGKNTIAILKARRAHLSEWATEYYKFIAKEVDVPGTVNSEQFDVQRLNDNETRVELFKINVNGTTDNQPFYARTFNADETKQIRLYGLAGEDKYVISGNGKNKIRLTIIGGTDKDSITSNSSKANRKVVVYDDADNAVNNSSNLKLHISNDSSVHRYNYDWYRYDKDGFVPSLFYSNEDRLYVGLGYRLKHFAWRKQPFASAQLLDLHYSLMENAFSLTYGAVFPKLVAKADLVLLGNYDDVRWTYFFGLGNNTLFPDADLTNYTTRTRQWIIQPLLTKKVGDSRFNIYANIQGVKVINDTDRFISKQFLSSNSSDYNWQPFAGAGATYIYKNFNDDVVPTKGFYFYADAHGAQNIKDKSSHFVQYSGATHIYIPLSSKFSLGLRAGGATVTGNPEFYQYVSIGGPTLRAYRRDRFWGKTSFYNQNDLRYITNLHTGFFNGKVGLVTFFDNGRVWFPGENSNAWHNGYGAGILIMPFHLVYGEVTYGLSNQENLLQARLTVYLK